MYHYGGYTRKHSLHIGNIVDVLSAIPKMGRGDARLTLIKHIQTVVAPHIGAQGGKRAIRLALQLVCESIKSRVLPADDKAARVLGWLVNSGRAHQPFLRLRREGCPIIGYTHGAFFVVLHLLVANANLVADAVSNELPALDQVIYRTLFNPEQLGNFLR